MIQASPTGRRKPPICARAEVVDAVPEDELGEVDGQHAGCGGHRDEEQRVGAEGKEDARRDERDQGDRRQTDVDPSEVARTVGPDAGELQDRVRREADPTHRDGLEDVRGLNELTAA